MAKEQSVGFQNPADLHQCARKVVDAVKRARCYHQIKAVRTEWQLVFFGFNRAFGLVRTQTGKDRRARPLCHDRTRIVRHRADEQDILKVAGHHRQSFGKLVGNMFPQKPVAGLPCGASTHRPAAAAIKDFGRSAGRFHFGLVENTDFADKSAMLSLRQIIKPALDFALPERCPACGAIAMDGTNFCSGCWPKLNFINPPWCAACALPFDQEHGKGTLCVNCLASPPLHDGIRAVVAYDDMSRQIILRLKYGGKIGLAKLVARQLLRHLPDDCGDIVVVPVPLHWTRLWSRSFNQSALIAQELARLGGMRYSADLLLRTRRTPNMRGLSPRQRRKTVAKAFAINPARRDLLKNSRIILIDDVLTTGATSDGCIKALKKSGASWVQLFCWARAMRGTVQPENNPITLDA